ncbi:MAG: hypothetical protein KJ725_18390 [Gammaproteobacteria bacterium]|nr:hypothetical protein [Gammaproteobacteria bacterium]
MKEERGKRKEERGKRKEERGKRKEERGKRKEERGKRKEERGKHANPLSVLSSYFSVSQALPLTLNLTKQKTKRK